MSAALPEAVLGNLLVAALLAMAAAVAGRWGRRPAVTHALWLLVLVKLVTPPVVQVPVPCLPARPAETAVAVPPRPAAPIPVSTPAGLPDVGAAATAVTVMPAGVPTAAIDADGPVLLPAPVSLAASGSAGDSVPAWGVVGLAVWLAGAGAWLGLAVVRTRRFARFLRFSYPAPAGFAREVVAVARRVGLRRGPRVRVVPGPVSPLIWNLGRPTLFFPAALLDRLTPEKRAALVAHELAHLCRGDHWVRWLELVAVAAYWWCPLAWVARRELRRAEEDCCDAWVTHALPGSGPDYATALLDTIDFLAETRPTPAMATGIGDAASLRARLLGILAGPRPARLSAPLRLGVAALGFGLLPLGPTLARLAAAPLPTDGVTVEADMPAPAPVAVVRGEPVLFADAPDRLTAVGGPTLAAAASPDGRRLAVAAGSGVAVTDRATGRVLYTLAGHADLVAAVAYAPDGRTIATGSHDGTARLWRAADGTCVGVLRGHESWVLGAAFSPDGTALATAGYDRTVRVWDVAAARPTRTLAGAAAGVRCVAYSPDGRVVAAAGADAVVRTWDAATGAPGKAFAGHAGAVRGLAFAPGGKLLTSGGEDRTVRFWDVAAGHEAGPPVATPAAVTAVAYSPGGRVLLAGTATGRVLNVDPAARRVQGPLGAVVSIDGGAVRVTAHPDAVTAVLFSSPGGPAAVSVSQDGTALGWPPAGPPAPPALTYDHTAAVASVAVSADGRTLAAGARDGGIRVWDAATGQTLRTLTGHLGVVVSLAFSPDGGRLVSAAEDETVRVWDVLTGQVVRTLTQTRPLVRAVLAPDGRSVALACAGLPTVGVWSLETGKLLRKVTAPAAVTAVAYHPDGTVLATGTADGRVSVWDTRTGEERHRSPVRDEPCRVDRIQFAADGRTAALVLNAEGPDAEPVHEVVFWSPADGAVRDDRPRLAHAGPVADAAFTPDGAGVVTAGHDGRVYLWDAATGRPTAQLRGHADAVAAVAVSPDGAANYSAGDAAVHRWPLQPPARWATPASTP